MLHSPVAGVTDLIRNILANLQTILTPNLPEDPTVDQMRNYLEYIEVFKTADDTQSQTLSLQEQTFLAQKQLQKYYVQKYIKAEAVRTVCRNMFVYVYVRAIVGTPK